MLSSEFDTERRQISLHNNEPHPQGGSSVPRAKAAGGVRGATLGVAASSRGDPAAAFGGSGGGGGGGDGSLESAAIVDFAPEWDVLRGGVKLLICLATAIDYWDSPPGTPIVYFGGNPVKVCGPLSVGGGGQDLGWSCTAVRTVGSSCACLRRV